MPRDLRAFVNAWKTIPVVRNWPTAHEHMLSWRSPLDIDDVTITGLQVRIEASELLADEAVCVQLEYQPPKGRNEPLTRIEWRPLKAHNNKNRGPPEFRLRQFRATHIHPFDLNWLEAESRMLSGNLPIAVPLQDVESYNKFLDVCSNLPHIGNLGSVPPPPWKPRML